jgi:hypothetical protein
MCGPHNIQHQPLQVILCNTAGQYESLDTKTRERKNARKSYVYPSLLELQSFGVMRSKSSDPDTVILKSSSKPREMSNSILYVYFQH